jgi:superfamily I DNA/RNA helicase
MAQIIPEDSLTNSHPGPQLHFCLRELDDSYICRQQLSSQHEFIGLRYWIKQEKKSLLLATLPDQSISEETRLDKEKLTKHPLIAELINERNALFPDSLQNHTSQLLPIILLLPENLTAKETIYNKELGILAIGGVLISGAMQVVFQRCFGIAASEQVDKFLSARFCPELLVNKTAAKVHPTNLRLLNLQQEIALKKGITSKTPPNSSPYSLNLVTGMAGSGKSEIIAKRAALLIEQLPKSRILVLSHNKSISNALKLSISLLSNSSEAIQCLPFHEWCRKLLGGTWRYVYEDQETELFDLMVKRHFEYEALNRTGLIREINFIKDRNIGSEADYLSTIRSSNSLALSMPLRKRIWQAMIDIDTHLKDRKSSLWGDAASALLEALDDGKKVEPYTHILIDEGQYFAPVEIALIKKLLAPKGDLFIAADSEQGFYNRSINEDHTGLNINDCVTQLDQHHRCSPAISRVVDKFRTHRSMDTLKHPMYSIKQSEPINKEDHPQLLHFPTKGDQQNRLFSEIHQLIQRGYEANDILIINADVQSTRLLAQEIRDALHIRATALTGSMIIEDNTLKLCDVKSATGLQSKIVFVTGLENIFDAEQSTELTDRERHSLQTDNMRLMHMAMTRASERLYLLISTEQVPDSLILEGLDTPTLSKEHLAPVRYLNP